MRGVPTTEGEWRAQQVVKVELAGVDTFADHHQAVKIAAHLAHQAIGPNDKPVSS